MQTPWEVKCPWQLMKELSHGWWPCWPSVGNPEVSTACEPVIAFPKMLINTRCVKKEIPLSGLSVQNPPRDKAGRGEGGAMIHCWSYAHTESSTPVTHADEKLYTGVCEHAPQTQPLPQLPHFPWAGVLCQGQWGEGIPSHLPPPPGAEGKFRGTTHLACFIPHKPQKRWQSGCWPHRISKLGPLWNEGAVHKSECWFSGSCADHSIQGCRPFQSEPVARKPLIGNRAKSHQKVPETFLLYPATRFCHI